MLLALALVASGAALLVAGADLFAAHVVAGARAIGMSVLGFALITAGAEPEELVTAAVASGRQAPAIAAGDLVGTNVTIATLALGAAALAAPVAVGRRVGLAALGALALGGAAASALLTAGGTSRAEGALLLALYVVGLGVVWAAERRPPPLAEVPAPERARSRPLALLLALGGVAIMAAGGSVLVEGALRVADRLGGRQATVGLTLVALATSAELLALVAASARRRVAGLALAALVGSYAYNAGPALAVAALVRPLEVERHAFAAPLAFMLAAPLVAAALAAAGGRTLGRGAGAALLVVYGAFVAVAATL